MDRQKINAFIIMMSVAILAAPITVLCAILLIPVGIGIVLLFVIGDLVAHLYPFLFVGKLVSDHPEYFIPRAIGFTATILQWILVSLVFAHFAKNFGMKEKIVSAIFLLVFVGICTFFVLYIFDLQVVTERVRM